MPTRITTLLLISLLLATPAVADDVLMAIDDARKAYEAGDMKTSRQALQTASQLIAQQAAENLTKVFPAPLDGWQAAEATSSAGGGLLGVGVTQASRQYSHPQEGEVSISIMGDSPMLMQFAVMFSNPAMAGAMGKLIRLDSGQQAIQDEQGTLIAMIDNRYLIEVSGSANNEIKLEYLEAMDLAALTDSNQ
ncbi:hypothetical protein SAMN05661010_02601 [Modicisalibacter muralis]|uniref:Uncharacterized protein n=1 Tax=Modicisalibacter muralis TaxID=119000 RepID=A0A1G9N0Y9_9GAMM|nr:hypothetical protein [Halomonas muralis]SDL80202.1 hypothetical protein SAMN05661010_02601 [Halomonas muralis]